MAIDVSSVSQNISNVTHLPCAVAVSSFRDTPVFPCLHNKKPLTKNGFKNATLDPFQIIGWWESWPDALIGMPTGSESGYVILDVDIKKDIDGTATLFELEQVHGKMPETWISLTPSGGFHYWFKCPIKHVQTSAGKIGTGLDIRGNGGYVIIPPSAGYQWEASNPTEPAEMPAWLIELANQKKPSRQQSRKSEISQLIKRKGKLFYPRLSNISYLYNFPPGTYQAEFDGWTVLNSKAFMLKKGQARIEMRFRVQVSTQYFFIGGFHTVDVMQIPSMKGQITTGRRSQLAKDLQNITGGFDGDGYPVQINLDDVDLEVFADKVLQVTIALTKKEYAIVTAVHLPP